jgi:ATP-dependent DNA ligase
VFIAFDLLYLKGKDPRTLPLIERKAVLKKLLKRKRSRISFISITWKVMAGCCLSKS